MSDLFKRSDDIYEAVMIVAKRAKQIIDDRVIPIDENEGKKLNFLLQEMSREVNTIGSKTDLIEISHLVVQLKDELEKIREQVQNIV